MVAKRKHTGSFSTPGGEGRTKWHSTVMPAWRHVTCPLCTSGPGRSCMAMTSWVSVEGHEAGGFYTRRRQAPHPERVEAARKDAAISSERGALRKEISLLVQRKLTATQRMVVRQWARQPSRTVDELAAKVAELNDLADLAW